MLVVSTQNLAAGLLDHNEISTPTEFAPAPISETAQKVSTSSPAFFPDGRSLLFERGIGKTRFLYFTRLTDEGWTSAMVAPFSGRWLDFEPAVATDGSYIVFTSARPRTKGGEVLEGHWKGKDYPAILKGWVDRVFAYGLAYGYKGAGNRYRYGEGGLAGKRALLSVTAGGPEADYGPRGINGPLEELLFPITHGTLFFAGIAVLPTFAIYDAGRIDQLGIEEAQRGLEHRLTQLFIESPIPFRKQNSGDYPDGHALAPDVAPGVGGIRVHLATDAEPCFSTGPQIEIQYRRGL